MFFNKRKRKIDCGYYSSTEEVKKGFSNFEEELNHRRISKAKLETLQSELINNSKISISLMQRTLKELSKFYYEEIWLKHSKGNRYSHEFEHEYDGEIYEKLISTVKSAKVDSYITYHIGEEEIDVVNIMSTSRRLCYFRGVPYAGSIIEIKNYNYHEKKEEELIIAIF